MIKRTLSKAKQKLNKPITEKMYRFLMREGKYAQGRQPFDIEELRLLNQALISQNLFGIDGKMMNTFEKEFAMLYNIPYGVASTSGTAAIHTALGVLNLNPGDEVITAPITDLGTVIPILYQNAIPVFADIDHTYNMDPKDVEKKITPRTRAIVVVHLFGNPCNMDAMLAVARKHNIPLIEDCSQCHVTNYKGKYVGTIGDIGCFSFQQSKHMTTGDGGMTITANKAYYDHMKLFVDKGFARKGWGSRAYAFHAPNYRMNELTAAVGRAQLNKVKGVVEKRRWMGNRMTELLKEISEIIPAPITEGAEHSYWLYPLYLKSGKIEAFAKSMTAGGFWCGAGYTGKPIYLCTESLTAMKTYGTSKFPFESTYAGKKYEYKEGLCPKAEETLQHLVSMPWDESWSEERLLKAFRIMKETLASLSGSTSISVSEKPKEEVVIKVQESTQSTKKIRMAIIGCGLIGHLHAEGYRKNPDVEMVAYVDTDLPKIKAFTVKDTGAKAFSDYREMLKEIRPDAVSLCTIPSSHKEIACELLSKGVHVLCEKPLALSVSDSQIMLKTAKEHHKILLPAFKFRFHDEMLEAKAILEKGLLGKILNFRVMFAGYQNMQGTWYVNKELSGGGVIMDTAPHALDLIRYLLGDITDVHTQSSFFQDLPVEDTAQLICRLKNGTTGSIEVSWTTPLPSAHYCEIYGEEGTMLLGLSGLSYKFKTWTDWKQVPNKGTPKDGFNRQLNHFVECIQGKHPHIVKPEDGLETQLLLEKAYQQLI
jgi:perosamine synthetase